MEARTLLDFVESKCFLRRKVSRGADCDSQTDLILLRRSKHFLAISHLEFASVT